MSVVLAIPDCHAPAMHPDAIQFLSAIRKKYRPEVVVHLGDLADFHCASRFTKSSKNSADDEIEQAVLQLGPMYDMFNTVKICVGNHEDRLSQRIAEAGLPQKASTGLSRLLECPDGWKWANEHVVDGTTFEHGTQYSGKDGHVKAAAQNMSNTVMAHLHHSAGIAFVSNRRHLIWGANMGCLIDWKSHYFDYARKMARPIISCGLVIDGVPQVIPMALNSNGRWAKGGL